MARQVTYAPPQTLPAGASTAIVPYQVLRGQGVISFGLSLGAGNVWATAVDRIRVNVNGSVWWDVGMAALLSFLRANLRPKDTTWTGQWLVLPFFAPEQADMDMQDMCQLPPGNPEIQIQTNGTFAGGNLGVSIQQTTIQAATTRRLYGRAMNIPALAVNQAYPFSAPGVLRGAGWRASDVAREVLTLGGFEAIKLTGGAFAPPQDLIEPYQIWESGPTPAGVPKWYDLGDEYLAPSFGTSLLLDTGAAWNPGEEITLYCEQELGGE